MIHNRFFYVPNQQQQMHQHIYYVGHPHPLPTPTSHPPAYPHTHHRQTIHTLINQNTNNNNTPHHTRTTSSPKTQRSTYAITLQKLRHRSPKVQPNTLNATKTNQPIKADNGVLTIRNASTNQLSSAFNRISVKPVDRQKKKAGNLFRKVEQPRYRLAQRYRVTETNRYQKAQCTQNSQQNEQIVANMPPRNNKQQQQCDQSQVSIDQHYKLQPLNKLFLCTRCYQFTPIIQLKSHRLSCRIPLNKQQFVNRWRKIINLLQEILRQHNTNALYRLVDRMEWYISQCQIGQRQGYILYSQELACVLSLRESIKLHCVSVDDLFWLIETVGDLLETKAIELQETAFWKICA